MTKKSICDTLRRTCLILAGSFFHYLAVYLYVL